MGDVAPSRRGRFVIREWSLTTLLLAAAAVVSLPPVVFILMNSVNTADPTDPFVFGFGGWIQGFGNPRTLDAIGYSFLLNLRTVIGITFDSPGRSTTLRTDVSTAMSLGSVTAMSRSQPSFSSSWSILGIPPTPWRELAKSACLKRQPRPSNTVLAAT